MATPSTGFWRPFFRTTDPGDPPVGQAWMRYDDETGLLVCVDSNGDSILPAPGGSPGGGATAIQFNDGSGFGGDEDAFAWDDSTKSFSAFGGGTSVMSFGLGADNSMVLTLDATQSPPVINIDNQETGGTIGIESDGDTTIKSDSASVLLVSGGGTGIEVGAITSVLALGFYGATPIVKPNVVGDTGANAALIALLAALADLGLITNSTS